MGGEVLQFEGEWAEYCKAKYCVGVSSGTDALYLSLVALKHHGYYCVETTPLTFFATPQACVMSGMGIVFYDVDKGGLLASFPENFVAHKHVWLPVNLYGRPAPIPPQGMVVEDAAQSHGIPLRGHLAAYSFYPTKNLGAMGQAGAVVTNDMGLADSIRELRTYGERERFVHYSTTGNHRMDEIQAAILRVKLPHLDKWNQLRRERAGWYNEELKVVDSQVVTLPEDHPQHVYHAYVIRVNRFSSRLEKREGLARFLADHGVQTAVRYPVPMHLQPALSSLGYHAGDFPEAEKWADENLNLPMYPELTKDMVKHVCRWIKEWVEKSEP